MKLPYFVYPSVFRVLTDGNSTVDEKRNSKKHLLYTAPTQKRETTEKHNINENDLHSIDVFGFTSGKYFTYKYLVHSFLFVVV